MLFTILFSSMMIPVFLLSGTILYLTYREYQKQKILKVAAEKESRQTR